MGNCKFCGQKVGFLRNVHKECDDKNNTAKLQLSKLIMTFFNNKADFSTLLEHAEKIGLDGFIKKEDIIDYVLPGLDDLIDNLLEDGLLSEDEEQLFLKAANSLNIPNEKLTSSNSYIKVIQGAVLREIVEGKIPSRVTIDGNIPFILAKDESIIWLFKNVKYSETKTRRTYVGGSKGLSVRIMKGVYYRTSSFKGHPVDTQELVYMGDGSLFIGSKNLYFNSSSKSFKIPYNKILTLEAYSDGLGLQKDNQTAKPQLFQLDDGWFIYNLVQNLVEINKK